MSDTASSARRTLLLLPLMLALTHCAIFQNAIESAGFERKLAAFSSDGCTLFPNRSPDGGDDWCHCCVTHDIAYWQGGTDAQRLAADEALRDCVLKQTGDPELAELVFDGVRIGGLPMLPTWYRWGYGWNYLRPAGPLTADEQRLVRARLRDHRRAGSPSPCE